MIIRILYLTFFSIVGTFAKPVELSQIDTTKSAIQVAVVKKLSSLWKLRNYEKIYDTYTEKRQYYIYYFVNIENKDRKKALKDIRKHTKNAFLINSSDIKSSNVTVATKIDEKVVSKPATTKVENTNKTIVPQSKDYQQALSIYKQKRYEEAYTLFNKLFFNDMGNILINYYLGRSAYETKKYEFAISAYDRILIAEPNNIRVRLELAQTYLQMGLLSQALTEFNSVLASEELPLKVQEKVIANVEAIKQKQTKHFFNITALLGMIYDSNVSNSPNAGSFSIYNPTLDTDIELSNSGEKNSTMIYQLASIFSYKYKVDDNFALENNLTLLNLKYDDYKEKDIHYISTVFQPTYYTKDYKIALNFNFEKVFLGHHPYQHNFYITPSITKVLDKTLLYTTGLKLGQINYKNEPTRNSHLVEWQNSLKYVISPQSTFTFSGNLGKELEREESRTDVSTEYYSLGVANNYMFTKFYSLQSSVLYKETLDVEKDVNFLSRKRDKKKDFALNLQRKFGEKSIISAGGTYSKQDSNHESSPYSKYTIKLNYIQNF